MSDVTYTHGVRPLPHTLSDPSRWIVPQPDRLLNLFGEGGPANVAFATWAAEICQQRDTVAAITGAGRTVEELDAAATNAARLFHQTRPLYGPAQSRGETIASRQTQRRALLRPLVDAGLTMRQIARYTNLTLADVVATLLNERCAPLAERYCTCEELLRAGTLDRLSARALARQCGIDKDAIRRLAAHVGIAVPARKGGRQVA